VSPVVTGEGNLQNTNLLPHKEKIKKSRNAPFHAGKHIQVVMDRRFTGMQG